MRYCHRIFSRNPLRSCLGPWTHTRVTFIPFFRFKAVEPNTSPSLSVPLLTKFGRQAGIVVGFGCGSSFISFEDRTFIIRAQLWKNLNYPGGYIFFSPPFLPLFSPKFLSIYRWKVGNSNWTRFLVNFYHLCPRSGMVEIRSLQYRIYSVRILSGRRHKRRCLFNFSLILVCSYKRISNFNCGCL